MTRWWHIEEPNVQVVEATDAPSEPEVIAKGGDKAEEEEG